MSPARAYMICTSPRSGSTLLCKLLQETGIAGHPDSHFHAPSLDAWLEYQGMSRGDFDNEAAARRAVFAAARATGKGQSDIFALRMQRHSFGYFTNQLAQLHPDLSNDAARIEATFGHTRYLHLTRADKLAQAISYVKAQQSGLWHMAPDGSEIERNSEPRKPLYDAQAIATQLATFAEMDAQWQAWFSAQDIIPLHISYDALSDAPYATLQRVMQALALPFTPPDKATPPVAKLADSTNLEWARRFRASCPS